MQKQRFQLFICRMCRLKRQKIRNKFIFFPIRSNGSVDFNSLHSFAALRSTKYSKSYHNLKIIINK